MMPLALLCFPCLCGIAALLVWLIVCSRTSTVAPMTSFWQAHLKRHVEYIKNKAHKKLWYSRWHLTKPATSIKILACKTPIRPTFKYASEDWNLWQTALIDKLEKIQALSAHFLNSDYPHITTVTKLRDQGGLQSLKQWGTCRRLKLISPILYKNVKVDKDSYLQFASQKMFFATLAPHKNVSLPVIPAIMSSNILFSWRRSSVGTTSPRS